MKCPPNFSVPYNLAHTPQLSTIYFETSAVNSIVDWLKATSPNGYGTVATRKLQIAKGRDWRISQETVYEILLTGDAARREELIEFCQHLFSPELLPTPCELIIPWIDSGMPVEEPRRGLISASPISNIWRDIAGQPDKTFDVDEESVAARIDMTRRLGRDIHHLVRGRPDDANSLVPHEAIANSLAAVLKSAPLPEHKKPKTDDHFALYAASLYYIMYVLCAGVDMNNTPLDEFWKRRGVSDTQERIAYVANELTDLIYRGPFLTMALMTVAQAKTKFSRGLWFDSIHSVYLPYVELMFVSDDHFRTLRGSIPDIRVATKIVSTKEIEFYQTEYAAEDINSGPRVES